MFASSFFFFKISNTLYEDAGGSVLNEMREGGRQGGRNRGREERKEQKKWEGRDGTEPGTLAPPGNWKALPQ